MKSARAAMKKGHLPKLEMPRAALKAFLGYC